VIQQLVLQASPASGSDAHVADGAHANFNLGSANPAFIGLSKVDKSTTRYRYLIRFDLSDLPVGVAILDATLTLTVAGDINATGDEFHAYRLTRSDWTELGVTWNVFNGLQPWTAPGGDFVTDGGASVTLPDASNLVFDSLTGLAVDAVAHRAAKLELIVVGPDTNDTRLLTVYSSEEGTPANRPRLVINYVAPPQLAINDHGDGSGATATVSGAESDSTTTILLRTFNGEPGDGSWTQAGAIDGNGTVELMLPAGHYFAYAISAVESIHVLSRVAYFVVSDGLESIHTRCLTAVQARIRLLSLDGVANERVVIEKVPTGRNLSAGSGLPAIVLSPERAAMPASAGTNGADDVHYDVLVAILDRDNQEPTLAANLDRHLLWRQQIARAFRNQRLPGVPEVINSEVEPAEGLLDEAWKRELMASALRLRFTSRETRGF